MMRAVFTFLICVAISGCAATPRHTAGRAPQSPAPAGRSIDVTAEVHGERIAGYALSMVGRPYRYGGSSPDTGFDCSGLVYYAFSRSGMSVPRTSREQFRQAQRISLREARRGDLLFFQDQELLSHVGIYLGDDRFVHAPSSGRSVSIANIEEPYYQMHLVGVGRLIQ